MADPFVILALPRTGTKMLVSALDSHPDISNVRHEFRGTEQDFWEHPYVLSNYWRDWMADERINLIHVYREDSIAGACSMMMLSYTFPDSVVDMPPDEVTKCAENRRRMEAVMEEKAHHSISYEALCDNKEADRLCHAETICDWLGVDRHELVVGTRKEPKTKFRNQEELLCLV